MTNLIVRTLDGERYWVTDGGIIKLDYDKRIGSIVAVSDALKEAIKESEQLDEDIKEEVEKIRRILRTPNRTLDDIYSAFEEIYLTTRFEDVKNLAKSVMDFIEELSLVGNLEVFTRQMRVNFIYNLRSILSELGYKVVVEDFGGSSPIIVAIKGDKEKLMIKLDAKAYRYIRSTPILKELLEGDDIVELLSEEKKRNIVRKLKKLSV